MKHFVLKTTLKAIYSNYCWLYINFYQLKFSFGKTLPKCFWEVDVLPDDSSNTEYISLVVSLFNPITIVFFY